MTTRTLLAAALAAGFLAAAAPSTFAQQAPAPVLAKPQAGWLRLMVGDAEVTALSDGSLTLQPGILTGATQAEIEQHFKNAHMHGHPMHTSVNAYLIRHGGRLVLVDAGAGAFFGPSLNKLQGSLKAAGYTPDQVTDVLITHLHADHVGGLVAGENRVFPNATIRVDKRDTDFWLSAEKMNAAPQAAQGFFKMAQASLAPYQKAGKLAPFEGAVELAPGIRSQPTPGHTPGHSFYVLESKGQKLVFWGDLMHVEEVQFPAPQITVSFDIDSPAAKDQRLKAFADAAEKGYLVAPTHVTYPGIGRLAKEGTGYRWWPVRYVNDANP